MYILSIYPWENKWFDAIFQRAVSPANHWDFNLTLSYTVSPTSYISNSFFRRLLDETFLIESNEGGGGDFFHINKA